MPVIAEIRPAEPPQGAPAEIPITSDIMTAQNGALWILQACASTLVQRGHITSENVWDGSYLQELLTTEVDRVGEILPQLTAATELSGEIFGYVRHRAGDKKRPVYLTHKPPLGGYAATVDSFIIGYFSEFAVSTLAAREQLRDSTVIMVAGHQGVGKGTVTKFLEQSRYTVLPMSRSVGDVTAVWGLQPGSTIDKIVTGQVLKQYFGDDILVRLGCEYLASEGHTRIVIDGPRIVPEAEAVLAMGGTLIGIIADESYEIDREIRRGRIVARAQAEPSRQGDVAKFDQRETIEAPHINRILELVPPENRFRNAPGRSDDMLAQLVRRFL